MLGKGEDLGIWDTQSPVTKVILGCRGTAMLRTKGCPAGGGWAIAIRETSGSCSHLCSHTRPRMVPLFACSGVKGRERDASLRTASLLG